MGFNCIQCDKMATDVGIQCENGNSDSAMEKTDTGKYVQRCKLVL